MSQPVASVIINNHNYGRFLKVAIESALAQTCGNVEVIVVDDGSTDNSAEVIHSFGGQIRAILQPNAGQNSAANTGFAASGGEIVCFLDSDDALLPHAIEQAVALLQDPRVAKVHWQLRAIGTDGEWLDRLTPMELPSEGDLRAAVLRGGPDSYPAPPTSGSAWARRYLGCRMPIPEGTIPLDAYLELLAPFFGEIRRLDTPGGLYRVHGGNKSGRFPFSEQIASFDKRRDLLAGYLAAAGFNFDREAWKPVSYAWWEQLAAVGRALEPLIPAGAQFLLIDDNQWGQGELISGRRARPFVEKEGQYWGPPHDDDHALAELERARASGMAFAVLAEPAFWWLDHYVRFAEHLRSNGALLFENERVQVFRIRP